MPNDSYTPNPPKPAPRQPQPGEKLYEVIVGHDRYLFERRDHGPDLGVECQIFKNEDLLIRHRFDPRLDASRPSRGMAIAWADEERSAIKRACCLMAPIAT